MNALLKMSTLYIIIAMVLPEYPCHLLSDQIIVSSCFDRVTRFCPVIIHSGSDNTCEKLDCHKLFRNRNKHDETMQ